MKEDNIRPKELFNQYLALAREDVKNFFSDQHEFVKVDCPACGSLESKLAFEKLGFKYQLCQDCASLYLSPRPTAAMIDRYYEQGQAVKFWSTQFYKQTAEARREKIFKPRAELAVKLAVSAGVESADIFADIGSGYGIFLEEVKKLNKFKKVIGIEPAPNMVAEGRAKGFEIIPKPVEQIQEGEVNAELASAFEVLEHVFSPLEFLQACGRVLKDGGRLLFTTLAVSGFDLQVLWKDSKSIYPPHHINLLSYGGMRKLVERAGLTIDEISTPGQLDLDIVRNAIAENPDLEIPRFARYIIEKCDSNVHESFQTFLSKNNLSSHLRCVARK